MASHSKGNQAADPSLYVPSGIITEGAGLLSRLNHELSQISASTRQLQSRLGSLESLASEPIDADTLNGLTAAEIIPDRSGFVTASPVTSGGGMLNLPGNGAVGLEIVDSKGDGVYFENTPGSGTYNGARALRILKSGWYHMYFNLNNTNAVINGMPGNSFAGIKTTAGTWKISVVVPNTTNAETPVHGTKLVRLNAGENLVIGNGTTQVMRFFTGPFFCYCSLIYLGDF
jgi:hypothetical protein